MGSDKIVLPLLPLRDIIVFPFMVLPLFVGRDKSVLALEKSMAEQPLNAIPVTTIRSQQIFSKSGPSPIFCRY